MEVVSVQRQNNEFLERERRYFKKVMNNIKMKTKEVATGFGQGSH